MRETKPITASCFVEKNNIVKKPHSYMAPTSLHKDFFVSGKMGEAMEKGAISRKDFLEPVKRIIEFMLKFE